MLLEAHAKIVWHSWGDLGITYNVHIGLSYGFHMMLPMMR